MEVVKETENTKEVKKLLQQEKRFLTHRFDTNGTILHIAAQYSSLATFKVRVASSSLIILGRFKIMESISKTTRTRYRQLSSRKPFGQRRTWHDSSPLGCPLQ